MPAAAPSASAAGTASVGRGSAARLVGRGTTAVSDLLRSPGRRGRRRRRAGLCRDGRRPHRRPRGAASSTPSRRPAPCGSRGSRSVSRSSTSTRPTRRAARGPQVDVRYRVDDLDRGDRVARLEYDLVRSGRRAGRSRRSARSAPAPPPRGWRCRPCGCERGEHAVVAGTVPAARLAEHAAVVDRAVPAPARAVVGHAGAGARAGARRPATEADALLGRTGRVGGRTGGRDHRGAHRRRRHARPATASCSTPRRSAGSPRAGVTSCSPTSWPTSRCASTVPGRPAGWLAEGYADHVGYARADVSTARLVAPLVAAIRTGHGPRRLPSAVGPAADQRRHRGALPRGVAGRGAHRPRPRGGRPAPAGRPRARRPARTPTPRPPPTRRWCRCSAPPGPS